MCHADPFFDSRQGERKDGKLKQLPQTMYAWTKIVLE